MRFAVLFSAAMLTFPLQLALTGWAADWLTARYGSAPTWTMWFFIGLESFAWSYVIAHIWGNTSIITRFVKFYLEHRKKYGIVILKINGVKIIQLKGARSQSDGDSDKLHSCVLNFQLIFFSTQERDRWEVLGSVFAAPLLETALCQVLIIALLRLIGIDMAGQIAVSAFVFAYLHFKNTDVHSGNTDVHSGFSSISSGIYYGFTCAHWMQTSLWGAFWVTAAAHALHNFLCDLAYKWLISLIRKLFPKKKDNEQPQPSSAEKAERRTHRRDV